MIWCIIICYFIVKYSDVTALANKFTSLKEEYDKRKGIK